MDSLKGTARVGLVVLALALALVVPSGAFATDGEIGDMGNTNSITDVFVSVGRAAVNVDYLRDCPAGGITDCWIEVQFVSRCPEVFCGWVSQNFVRIPATGAARANCMGSGNEDNEWYINYRTAYTGSAVKTVQWKGEVEGVWDIGGGFVYRLIAEAMFNVTGNVGFSGGTTVETVTAQTDYGPIVQAATSAGADLVTC